MMTPDAKRRLLHELMRSGTVDVPGCSPVGPAKAKEMLHDGTAHGHPLTTKQRGWLGVIASGKTPTRMRQS